MKRFWQRRQKKDAVRLGRSQPPRSQRVISYYTASRRQLDSFERQTNNKDYVHKRAFRTMRRNWFAVGVSVVVLLLIGVGMTVSSNPYVKIEPVVYREAAQYQQIARVALGSDWRNRSKVFLQHATLEAEIAKALPEARAITVSAPLLGRDAEVRIVTDKPLAWFDQTGSVSLIIGERGKLLVDEQHASQKTKLTRNSLSSLRNDSGIVGEAGDQFLSPEEATALAVLLSQIAADGDALKPQLRLTTAPREIEVREPDRGGYVVRFLLNDTIAEQYGALRAVQKQLATTKAVPAEYIDVRLVDKVYYK